MAGNLSAEDATRLVDFVNDKIQSIEDLQSLDTLLQSLQEQQDIQRQQVSGPLTSIAVVTRLIPLHFLATGSGGDPQKCHEGFEGTCGGGSKRGRGIQTTPG